MILKYVKEKAHRLTIHVHLLNILTIKTAWNVKILWKRSHSSFNVNPVCFKGKVQEHTEGKVITELITNMGKIMPVIAFECRFWIILYQQ